MKIVIPSNREIVTSIAHFPDELLDITDIVRHHMPKNGYNIGWMRQQYIDEYLFDGHENIIMLDDDLVFGVRDLDNNHVPANSADILVLFKKLQSWLDSGDKYVGVSNRFMANTKPSVYYNSAPSMIYGICLKFMDDNNIRFDDIPLCEDWHVALSMYEHGVRGKFTSDWCVTDGSNGKGGLEYLRNSKHIREAMFKLKKLHPSFVKLREKEGGKHQRHITNLGMIVQWKKAYQWGLANAGL